MDTSIAFDAIHLIDKDVYLVKILRRGKIFVSGIEIKTDTQVVVSDPQEIEYFYLSEPKKIIDYKNEKTNEHMSPEAYAERLSILKGDSDGYTFPSLDEEFAYRSFVESYKPIYSEQVFVKGEVQFNIVEILVDSREEFIKSLWNSPKISNDKKFYSLDRLEFAKDYLKTKCGEISYHLDLPNHSGIQYAKINGKYVFQKDVKKYEACYINTLEECKNEKQKIRDHIDLKLKILMAEEQNKKLANAGSIVRRLYQICQEFDDLHLKRNEAPLSQLNRLITEIEKTL
jgi:hypothetical protein